MFIYGPSSLTISHVNQNKSDIVNLGLRLDADHECKLAITAWNLLTYMRVFAFGQKIPPEKGINGTPLMLIDKMLWLLTFFVFFSLLRIAIKDLSQVDV